MKYVPNLLVRLFRRFLSLFSFTSSTTKKTSIELPSALSDQQKTPEQRIQEDMKNDVHKYCGVHVRACRRPNSWSNSMEIIFASRGKAGKVARDLEKRGMPALISGAQFDRIRVREDDWHAWRQRKQRQESSFWPRWLCSWRTSSRNTTECSINGGKSPTWGPTG